MIMAERKVGARWAEMEDARPTPTNEPKPLPPEFLNKLDEMARWQQTNMIITEQLERSLPKQPPITKRDPVEISNELMEILRELHLDAAMRYLDEMQWNANTDLRIFKEIVQHGLRDARNDAQRVLSLVGRAEKLLDKE
jgi:hypothetical protein